MSVVINLLVGGAFYSCSEVERVAPNALDFVHVKKRLEGKPLHHKTSGSVPGWGVLSLTRPSPAPHGAGYNRKQNP
ncbi:MAG TPA: hypothetical protein VMM36_13200 [Opitutaceae bacterium]|nr:hypothetical protein [Opitutaceae bacterium]